MFKTNKAIKIKSSSLVQSNEIARKLEKLDNYKDVYKISYY